MELLLFLAGIFSWDIVNGDSLSGANLFEYFKSHPVKYVCPDLEIREHEGVISSPFYPSIYPNHLSCSWHIQGNIGDVITVVFDDLDIEESCCCDYEPCCQFNWVKIEPLDNATENKFCGKSFQKYEMIRSTSHKLWIKFNIAKFVRGGRGFRFHYKITPKSSDGCDVSELKCGNKCISADSRCNGIPDCEDGSDEHRCSNRCSSGRSCQSIFQCYDASKHCDGVSDCTDFSDELDCGFCAPDLIRCGKNSSRCYNPITQRCDRIFNCLNGEDEKDCSSSCPGKIMCESRRGCYLMTQRCNGVAQCEDASDEKNCVSELCNYEHGGFLCDNGHCIQEVWTCDRTDDCGDGSDERNCLRNNVLTAAIMGSLICALLLVIAISCTCRLHALRMLESRILSRETPLSRMSREFFCREPPPSYAAAVESQRQRNICVENMHYGVPVHRSHRRIRRPRHMRSRRAVSNATDCFHVGPGRTISAHPQSVPEIEVPANSCAVQDNPQRPQNKSETSVLNCSGRKRSPVHKEMGSKSSVNADESVYLGAQQDPQSLSESVDPQDTSTGEPKDHPVQSQGDHYYCDSDSEPLVV